ncbi:exodeoxyribonuclease VII large subunit [Alkalihalobacillus alcalophilus ATCC 27647 = CGMCC 1.3604]|uniref:Exodeoxyribonuclease 7 large subunit n=1 Tax=Alkalihalobacillus alcalophilus ATCC 27647 = CGMCC 1.3604 TaxID=1218173 RepID=A0A4V3X807_ALKAL|nr:exodeoxyribonuclease VII large subunit [Alkalihalobacillus alcalophilus]MED1561484.1 exodeoxyribonuclease VII large subunit [Alkalihalobacillus alcalophilus]THG88422.1 exodeoxyribonuclease VII large subunit [Alkalihalobacillus alcalophilus ATCC 27647 = CGMCC 1.3604]
MLKQNVLTVTEVTRHIKTLMEKDFQLQNCWLRGEISNFKRHSRGHMYFTIKDENTRMQAVMFAGNNRFLDFNPENGMKVIVQGEINVYEPYGSYQMYVREMQPDGIGSLYLAYEKLKADLEKEGLFSLERKKALPQFPKNIAIITSPTGAAIKDIASTLKRRYPIAHLALFPVLVQGEHAPASIINAIEQANLIGQFDVVLLGRGGGSIEELWAFNDEHVARAIADSNIPIISAVGHETDFTISDFVADLRAPTPTGAAEMAVPDLKDLFIHIQQYKQRLMRQMNERVQLERKQLERLNRSYAFRYPAQLIRQKEQELDGLMDRQKRAMSQLVASKKSTLTQLHKEVTRSHPKARIEQTANQLKSLEDRLKAKTHETIRSKQQGFQSLITQLKLVSPLQIMERGYSLVYNKDNEMIKKTTQVTKGEHLSIQVTDGLVHCHVVDTIRTSDQLKEVEGDK